MATVKKLGNFSGNDIELCRAISQKAVHQAVQALLEASIPFTQNSKRIPFYKRERYHGAKEMLVITINPHRYSQARRVLDSMDMMYKRRLKLSNY